MKICTVIKRFLLSSRTQVSGASSEELRGNQSRDYVKYKHVSDNDEATDLKAELFKSRSVDEILDDIGLRLPHLKIFLLLGLINMTDSLEVSMLSIVLPVIKSHWNLSSLLAGVLTLSLSIGMIFGCWFWGWVADKYGRKRALTGSTTFILVFAFASVFSPNYSCLWISLFLVGFGVAAVFEVYVMTLEFFPPKYRTMVSVLDSVAWTLGFLLSAIVSTQLSEMGYHWALAIVCFPSGIFLIGLVFLPDTAHYHLAAGDEQKALNLLQDFAPEMDLSDTKLKREPESKRADITQLFRSGYWKITTCACVMCFTIVMTYYSLVYSVSNVASENSTTAVIPLEGAESNDDLYSVMAWMNLPEMVIVISSAVCCYFVTVKRLLLVTLFLPFVLQIVSLFLVNHRTVLLVVTMLSRSLLAVDTALMIIYTSMLYPTANRGLGVGVCISVSRVGIVLGPFIFQTLFVQAYFYGIVLNIGILLLAFTSTALLPSRSSVTLG